MEERETSRVEREGERRVERGTSRVERERLGEGEEEQGEEEQGEEEQGEKDQPPSQPIIPSHY